MTYKENLQRRIRGWFPQEPQFPHKPLQIKLETNPLKLKQSKAKFTINVAQFIAVVLAVSLILSGLYLNSISTTKTSYNLPISSTTYHTPYQVDGTNYNCCINLFISPQISGNGIGTANSVRPIFVYLNDPNNITSGVYVTTLQYLRYNETLNAYIPQETNETGTFSPDQRKEQNLIFSAIALKPPFEPGPANLQPIVSRVVFTLYTNASEAGASSFTITTPIDGSQSGYVINYPYETYARYLLTFGVISLIAALAIAFANLKKKAPISLYKIMRS